MPVVETSVQNYQKCIDECNRCMQVCEECFNSCLKEDDVKARAKCLSLLKDCADLCALSAKFMAGNSDFAKQLCGVCACDACANECAMFKDTHCQQCADECRKCATECRNMATM